MYTRTKNVWFKNFYWAHSCFVVWNHWIHMGISIPYHLLDCFPVVQCDPASVKNGCFAFFNRYLFLLSFWIPAPILLKQTGKRISKYQVENNRYHLWKCWNKKLYSLTHWISGMWNPLWFDFFEKETKDDVLRLVMKVHSIERGIAVFSSADCCRCWEYHEYHARWWSKRAFSYATSWILESGRCHRYRSSLDRSRYRRYAWSLWWRISRKWIRSWCRNTVCVHTISTFAIAVAFGILLWFDFSFTLFYPIRKALQKPKYSFISFWGDCIFPCLQRTLETQAGAVFVALFWSLFLFSSDAAEIEDVKNQFPERFVGKQNNGKNYFPFSFNSFKRAYR